MTDDPYRAFRDECDDERDALAELLYESMEREKALEEACDRAEARARDLDEAQGELLDANDLLWRQNRALIMEIEAWRANGKARGLAAPRKLPAI